MSAWALLFVPGALAALCALLALTSYAENRILAPEELILRALRATRMPPEYAERLATREFERVLRDNER